MGLVRWCRGVGDESDGYNAPPSFRKAVGVTLAPFTATSTPAPGPARRMHGTLSLGRVKKTGDSIPEQTTHQYLMIHNLRKRRVLNVSDRCLETPGDRITSLVFGVVAPE